MKHLFSSLLLVISILLVSCTPSTNSNNKNWISDSDTHSEKSKQVVIAYLPIYDWEFEEQFASVIWDCLTHINICFAKVKADGSLNFNDDKERIEDVIETARKHNVKVLISFAKNTKGEFATAINDPKARVELIKHIVSFTKKYKLDGFDIDYEEYDNWDKNFPSLLIFVQGLFKAKDKNMLMTCAVNSRWLNYGTEWEQYFDYINLMSYDRGAFTDTPTQHASYEDFVKDLEYWNIQCRTPKNKIVGGLPFYGYSWDESLKDVVDDVRGIRYHTILEHFGIEAAEKDVINKTYYNGRTTIRDKCIFIKDNNYAGVMVWQLFQDAYQEKDKLIKVVGETINPPH